MKNDHELKEEQKQEETREENRDDRNRRLEEMDSRLLTLQDRRSRIQEGVLSAWMSVEDLEILADYMQNEFLSDYDEDLNADEFDSQKRSVFTSGLLSQDALYDEIQEYYFLAKDMMSAAREMLMAIGSDQEDDSTIEEDALMSEAICPADPED